MKARAVPRAGFVLWAMLIPGFTAVAEGPAAAAQTLRIDNEVQIVESQIDDESADTKLFTHDEGSGVVTLYPSVNGNTKLVVQFVSGETGEVSEYYFRNGALFYAVNACRSFESTSDGNAETGCWTISEDRYYFDEGNLIRWLQGHSNGSFDLQEMAADVVDWKSSSEVVVQNAARWLTFARSSGSGGGESGAEAVD